MELPFDPPEGLLAALRQCDGVRLQCLLMVRDDFWLALSRFMSELDVDMVAGQNVALVDLFDLRHAKRVLAAFGRAYESLPADPQQMADTHQRFLDQAVASELVRGAVAGQTVNALAASPDLQRNYVISVVEQELAQEASRRGLAERLDVQRALMQARYQILLQALQQDVVRHVAQPTDAEIQTSRC